MKTSHICLHCFFIPSW